jgi:glycosyltransferase involved in cell wall biosynthesis
MKDLAIVIPAYKNKYFAQALNSLAMQTNKDFTLYIGDDCSPDDLKETVDQFMDTLDIVYKRFDYNIGAAKLVEQWRRCIDLTQGEEWLWLFSDDDLVDTTCVEAFYNAVEENKGKLDVYRFNTCVINDKGEITNVMPIGPTEESSAQMAYHLLMGDRGNSMPDHIYSREVYNKSKGYVYTAYASGADWAMSILFSKDKGIYTISGPKMYWRLSGINISSAAKERRAAMLEGHVQFIEWLLDHFLYLKQSGSDITYDMIVKAALYNLSGIVAFHYKGFDTNNIIRCFKILHNKLGWSYYKTIDTLLAIGMHTEFGMNKLHRINSVAKKVFRIPA